ncbi:BadF/BadG/BcrA/BcrD ATPase family protein [Ideonella sp. DXS29W]|uniref:BadF/BadG/BcrA/BcrD ATPase family protein n=1 Tax=Ideonella lacteola TaxID=2984193 RepID=A0ABU9BUT6_9BURK
MTLSFLIGVDGGGTGTRARLCDTRGQVLGQGNAGPSSLSHGVPGAWLQILQAVERAFAAAALPTPRWQDCALGAGLAGVNAPEQAAAFRAANPGFSTLVVDTDSFTALVGAHAGEPGLVLIAGTGSVAEVWRPDGTRRIAGGWGFPIGDEGGGAWLGLEAVRLAQQTIDGRATPGPLSEAVCRATGHDADSMLNWCARANQTAYAGLAPLVFDHAETDAQAAALLDASVLALDALVHALDPQEKLPVVCSGSVAKRLQNRLPSVLRQRCREPRGDAADGALHLLRLKLAEAP